MATFLPTWNPKPADQRQGALHDRQVHSRLPRDREAPPRAQINGVPVVDAGERIRGTLAAVATLAYDLTVVPRIAVELPLVLPAPEGFDPYRPETWPETAGRLEYVQGRLVYMPPCGDDQQQIAADLVGELMAWRRNHPEFVVGTNEAGMILGGDVRGADGAVWKRDALGGNTGGFPRVAPVLAVEVAGRDDTVALLREKARWYLAHHVAVVWILIPGTRSALVVTDAGETAVPPGARIPPHTSLPGLEPRLEDLFRQVAGG